MWRYTMWWDLKNVTTGDKDGGGAKKLWNSCDLIYGWPLSQAAGLIKVFVNVANDGLLTVVFLQSKLDS